MKRYGSLKKRSKSPELFNSPSEVNVQIQPLPNPDDVNYRRKLFERLQDEEFFDLLMNRCNEMSLEEAFEPITKNYFQAKRSIVWIYDQKESIYLSHTLNRKISADRSYLETIVSQKNVCNIPSIDDEMTSDQLMSDPSDHHLFIPLSLNNGILIAVLQLSRDENQEQFSQDEEEKGIFIMQKFIIYGTCFFGAPSRVMIASNISQISTPKKTIESISNTLAPIFKYNIIEFWYFKAHQDEYAKYNSETGTFQGMYRCSIGIIAQCLTKNITINLDHSGNHQNYSATPDIDPEIPLLITTCEFDQTIWAMAMRGKTDHSRFSPMEEQLATILMPYIARSIAFSSGFSLAPSAASEQNDILVTKLLDAASDFISTLDLRELIRRIEEKVQSLVNASDVRLVIVDNEKKQIFCDFEEDIDKHKTFHFIEGFIGKSIQTQQILRLQNPSKDPYFNKELDVGPNTKTVNSLLVFPIIGPTGNVIAAVSCINKINADQFLETDESTVQSLSSVAAVALQNAISHYRALYIPTMFKVFSSKHFGMELKLSDIQGLLDDITKNAQMFTPQSSCSLFLVSDDDLSLFRQSGTVPIFAPKYANESFNSNDYQIHIIEPTIDVENEAPRQSSRSFVSSRTAGPPKPKPLNTVFCCVPIIHNENHIGVLVFTAMSTGTEDEIQMIKTYVSIALTSFGDTQIEQLAVLWKKKQLIKRYITDSENSFKVSKELQLDSIDDILNHKNETTEDAFKIIISGFDSFDLFDYFTIPVQNMLMLILEISGRYGSGYRSWNHTIETFKYLVKCLKIEELSSIDKVEILAALVSSLSLELDRPDFESLGPIAIEALSVCDGISVSSGCNAMSEIINTEECDIFVNLSSEDAKRVWKLISQFTLATDMKKHFEVMDTFASVNDEGEFNFEKEECRIAILELIMKCADLHDATKEFAVVNELKTEIADDFFKFGELFRCQGMEYNGDPSRMSIKQDTSNIGFFTYVVLPLFAAVAKVIPSVEPDVDILLSTIGKWREEITKQKKETEKEKEINENNEDNHNEEEENDEEEEEGSPRGPRNIEIKDDENTEKQPEPEEEEEEEEDDDNY